MLNNVKLLTMGSSPTSNLKMHAGRRSRHRRISSWDEKAEGRKGMVDPALISPASSGDLTVTRPKVHASKSALTSQLVSDSDNT